jgi:ubiquinone/menaquinone biosynthesis C-methylase UbiE
MDDLFELAPVRPGERVLDVACGTGSVARAAAQRVKDRGKVGGLDADAEMLRVAETISSEVSPSIEWCKAPASAIPYPDSSYDVVYCQQGLQFFPDRLAALKEMARVLTPAGRIGVSIFRPIQYNSGYAGMADALEKFVSHESAQMMRAPFAFGQREHLSDLLERAGFQNIFIRISIKGARFPSVEELLRREIVSWLAGVTGELEEDKRIALIQEIRTALIDYLDDDGLVFPMEAYVACASR